MTKEERDLKIDRLKDRIIHCEKIADEYRGDRIFSLEEDMREIIVELQYELNQLIEKY